MQEIDWNAFFHLLGTERLAAQLVDHEVYIVQIS